jgi:hypothetical protein
MDVRRTGIAHRTAKLARAGADAGSCAQRWLRGGPPGHLAVPGLGSDRP